MNRADKRIAKRIMKGSLPTAYCPWDDTDIEICGTLTTRGPNDHTKMGGWSYSSMRENGKAKILGYWPGKRWKQARAVFDRGGWPQP